MPIHDWTRVIAGTFHHFHHEWISTISRALNTHVLPGEYYAMAEQIAGGFGPDVLTLETPHRQEMREYQTDESQLATAQPQVRFSSRAAHPPWSRKRSRVVVRHRSGDDVVAMIEIISPGNKSSQHAVDQFVGKTLELLEAGIHLLLIDLLPPGPRDPQGIHGLIWTALNSGVGSEDDDQSFALPADEPLTLVAYSSSAVIEAFVEPVAVGRTLPDMPLFLRPHGHVSVPLERTYQAAFDAVPRRWQVELQPPPP
ncbi:MAG: DUF4058 family protein [Pirellulaceae bacterium]|nr:DUF4058 family protein [Planctomycetales bacterium]